MIVYNYDADFEVSDTCVRSSLLSWVELTLNPTPITLRQLVVTLCCYHEQNIETLGQRRLSVYGPVPWNGFPTLYATLVSPNCFRRELKTFHFRDAALVNWIELSTLSVTGGRCPGGKCAVTGG